MSWGQPDGCTCKWEGDDHYNSLSKYDPNCVVHNGAWHASLAKQRERSDLRFAVLNIEQQRMYERVRAMSEEEMQKVYDDYHASKANTSNAKRLRR